MPHARLITRGTTSGSFVLALVVLLIASPALAAPGELDPTFGGDGKVTTDFAPPGSSSDWDEAKGVAVAADGKIVAAGTADTGSGWDFGVARYNPDGSPDTTFGGDGTVTTNFGMWFDHANGVAIQSDGKIVVAGGRCDNSFRCDYALARYTTAGRLDRTFGARGKVTTSLGPSGDLAVAVAIQPDGKIVVAGDDGGDATQRFAVVRYTATGALDPSFSGDGKAIIDFDGEYAWASTVAVQPDGRIVVGGVVDSFGWADFGMLRVTPDGNLDAGFGSGGKVRTSFPCSWQDGSGDDGIGSIAIQADGRIVAAGGACSSEWYPERDFALARYTSDGALDQEFGTDGRVKTDFGSNYDSASGVAIQADGKIVAGGANNGAFALARYLHNGTLDPTFGAGGKVMTDFGPGNDSANAVATQADGKIVAAGAAATDQYANTTDLAVARYLG